MALLDEAYLITSKPNTGDLASEEFVELLGSMRDTLARFVARLGGGDGGSDAGTKNAPIFLLCITPSFSEHSLTNFLMYVNAYPASGAWDA